MVGVMPRIAWKSVSLGFRCPGFKTYLDRLACIPQFREDLLIGKSCGVSMRPRVHANLIPVGETFDALVGPIL